MKRPLEEITRENFAPFGTLVEQPTEDAHGSGPGWRWWAHLTTLAGGERPYALGYLDLQPAPLQFDWAERHLHSDELVIPLGGDCLVYVAPAEHLDQPDRAPSFDQYRVFRVRSGQAVLLKPGVWHGAPLALDAPLKALVVLLHNTGALDCHITRFPESPVEIAR